jgi:hypothetical protein
VLLLGLLLGGGKLPAALSTGGNCPRSCTGSGIIAYQFTHQSATRGTAQAGSGASSGFGGRWLDGWRLGRRLSRVKTALLHRPGVAFRLILLLLLGRLPFGRIDKLCGTRRGNGQKNQQNCIHYTSSHQNFDTSTVIMTQVVGPKVLPLAQLLRFSALLTENRRPGLTDHVDIR